MTPGAEPTQADAADTDIHIEQEQSSKYKERERERDREMCNVLWFGEWAEKIPS